MHPLLKSSSSMSKNKNSQIEFPISPQPVIVEEITHYTHSKHPLIKVDLPELFTCTGCKEYGSGNRFACQQCDFQLHDFCASSTPLLQSQNHPLHGQHQLVFQAKPKRGGISWPKCNVCNKSTKGFTFRCGVCSFQMHPCCEKFSSEINFSVHPHTLELLPPVNTSSSGTYTGIICSECKKKRSGGRVYRCKVCDYHLHAVCAKSWINGLKANCIPPPKNPRMIQKFARLVSRVVIEVVGRFVEGFGESVGEVLIQNVAKGKQVRRSRTVNN